MKRAAPFLLLGLALLAFLALLAGEGDAGRATKTASGPRAGGQTRAAPLALGRAPGQPAPTGDERASAGDPAREAAAPAGATTARAAGAADGAGDAELPRHPRGSLRDLVSALRQRRAPDDVSFPPPIPGQPPVRSAKHPGAPSAWVNGPDGRPIPVYSQDERLALEAEAEEVRDRRGSIVGGLELAGPEGISGWAYDWGEPGAVLEVALFVDGAPAMRVRADQLRPSIGGSPIEAARRGFFAPAPPRLSDGEQHLVQALVVVPGQEGLLELRGSPRKVGGDRPARGRLISAGPDELLGWALDPDRPGAVEVRLLLDGSEVGRLAADGPAPVGSSEHPGRWFRLPLPRLDPARAHHVQALVLDPDVPGLQRELAGSPRAVPGGGEEDQPPVGAMVFVDASVVTGWARDPETGPAPIEVDVYFDGRHHARLLADQDFPALIYQQPSTRHLFRVEVPAELKDGRTHLVSAFAVDPRGGPSPELSGSPASFKAEVNQAPVGWLDVVDHHTIGGWAYDADLGATPVEVEVWIDGAPWQVVRADGVRPDLVPVAAAEATHGFSVPAPELLRDGGFHTVRVLVRDHPDGPPRELPSSPRELGALRPWFGISIGAAEGRITISGVEPGSPAERGGLRAGDAILSLNGQPAPVDVAALVGWIGARTPGEAVALGLERREPVQPPPPESPDGLAPVQLTLHVVVEERVQPPS